MSSSANRRIIKLSRPISRVVLVPADDEPVPIYENDALAEETPPPPQEAPEPEVRLTEAALEEIRQEAFQQGVQQGMQQAAEAIQQEFQNAYDFLQNTINALQQGQQAIFQQSEATVLELVIAMTEKIVGALNEPQAKVIEHTLHKVLKTADIAGRVKVLVNPTEIEYLKNVENELRMQFPDLKELGIIPDESIAIGGCVIETDLGKIDARVNTQLTEMADKLRKLFSELNHDEVHFQSPTDDAS
jgi:flagellar assembly protein FliH